MKKILLLVTLLSSMSFANEKIQLEKKGEMKKINKIRAVCPVVTKNASSMPKGKLTTSIKTIYFNKDKLYDGSTEINNSKKQNMEVLVNNLTVRYGLGNGFDIRMAIPYVSKNMSLTNPSADETNLTNNGIGDVKFFTRYSLKSPKKGNSYFAIVDLGLSLPTGDTDKEFLIDTKKGKIKKIPTGMQLGDGSVDPMIGFAVTKLLSSSRLDLSTRYTANQEGDNDYKKGDEFNYNLAYSYAVSKIMDLQVEINGIYLSKNKNYGIENENSGGNIIYVTPGIHFKLNKRLIISGGVQLPVYRDLNGSQLSNDYKIVTKLAYKWN